MTSDPFAGGRAAPSDPAALPTPGRAPARPGPRRADDRRIAVASVLLAVVFLEESLAPMQAVGAAIATAGIVLTGLELGGSIRLTGKQGVQ